MRRFHYILIFLALGNLTAWSQDHYDQKKALSSEELFIRQSNTNKIIGMPGQKYLILDTSPLIGGFHRYRFFPGDNIKFRMFNETIRFNETISSISATSFSIGVLNEALGRMDYQEVLLKDVRLMKVTRRIPFISQAATLLPFAGLIYIGADFFNRGVDNKRFTTDGSSLLVGGALIAAGVVCYKLTFSSLKINGRNKLKVLETY